MEPLFVGIDVSKDRLDVALRPTGEVFVVDRNAAGLPLVVVNPAQVRALASGIGQRAKKGCHRRHHHPSLR